MHPVLDPQFDPIWQAMEGFQIADLRMSKTLSFSIAQDQPSTIYGHMAVSNNQGPQDVLQIVGLLFQGPSQKGLLIYRNSPLSISTEASRISTGWGSCVGSCCQALLNLDVLLRHLYQDHTLGVDPVDSAHTPKVGTWMKDDLLWFSFLPWFGVKGRSCSNFVPSTDTSWFFTKTTRCTSHQSLVLIASFCSKVSASAILGLNTCQYHFKVYLRYMIIQPSYIITCTEPSYLFLMRLSQ